MTLVLPLPASVDLTPPPFERLASSADCSEDGAGLETERRGLRRDGRVAGREQYLQYFNILYGARSSLYDSLRTDPTFCEGTLRHI